MKPINQLQIIEDFEMEFVEYNGGIFLKGQFHQNIQQIDNFINNNDLKNKIEEAECFINHIYILDLFENESVLDKEPFYDTSHHNFSIAISIGKKLVDKFAESLKSKFSNYGFLIYMTCLDVSGK